MAILRKILPVILFSTQSFFGYGSYANPEVNQLQSLLPISYPSYKILALWDSMGPATPLYQKCIDIGLLIQTREGYVAAIAWYQAILPYALLSADRFALYKAIANTYKGNENIEEAARYYIKALDYVGNDEKSEQKIAIIYGDLSGLMVQTNNFEKALKYINTALSIFEKYNDKENISWMLHEKGEIKHKQGYYSESISIYRLALDTISQFIALQKQQNKTNVSDGINLKASILNNIADNYLKMQQADSALLYLNRIKPYFSIISPYEKSSVLGSMGEALALNRDYSLAAHYIEQGLYEIEEYGNKGETDEFQYEYTVLQANGTLSYIYGKEGNYQKAWMYEKRYAELKDKFLSEKNIQNIDAIETKYQLTKKDKEIAETKLQISIQEKNLKEKNFLVAFMFLGITSLCCILYISRKNYRNKQKLSEKTRKIKQVEATIKGEEKERSRIAKELHDGVASELLAMKINLTSMAQEYEMLQHSASYKNVLEQSKEIALKLRQTAHNLMPANLRKNGLYTSIHTFIRKISSRNIHFTFQAYNALPELQADVEKIIFLIVLELIQNIIKHSKATEAIIQLDYYLEALTVTIEDNGVGIQFSEKETEGIGLSNVKESIAVLNATLDIKSSEYTGTTIYIEIPLEEHITTEGAYKENA